ncbi:MAG: molecular chaperone [Roseburia sp.]|nr:molecular chaperone [Roseburia sp.]MCM1279332.1 molecular chaperone [Robinsoniella sp.]
MKSYSLYLDNSPVKKYNNTYKKNELENMTTHQLRDICTKEMIIKGITNPLNRYELIETILRYRGEKEALFIRKVKEGGLKRLEDILKRKKGTLLKDEGTIHNPAKLILYKDLNLTLFDKYQVGIDRSKKNDISKTVINHIVESNVLLVGADGEICTILNLVSDGQEDEKFYLEREGEQPINLGERKFYYLLFFEKRDSDYLYNAYYNIDQKPYAALNYYKIPLVDLEVRDVEETEAILSIDFGTSNTTAGTYLDYGYINRHDSNDLLNGGIKLDAINEVQFLDNSKSRKKWVPMLPTVVCVADCKDPENVKYHFGYEAQKDTQIKYYDESFSIFYEIKRWVNSYHVKQEVMDKEGNTAMVVRGEIIRQYLLYVIACAQQRFKCKFKHLHLTSPVKLKQQYNQMFAELLPEYDIDTKHMLDEGTAVIYNTIHNLIEKKRYYEGEEISALIIDCGGGTTDLSSCNFVIENDSISYKVEIETTYENGDTNFGGNNITYRIMQYIKIMFAKHYSQGGQVRIDELITVASEDIFRFVDEFGREEVYKDLERAYDEAEAVIPTKFKNYENHTRDEYFMVKNNFYFLFDIADRMKKQFYMREGILRNSFQNNYEKENDDLKVTQIDRWNLVVREEGRLIYKHSFPEVVFNIKEIELLLKADIYEIVNKFLHEFYEDHSLSGFSIIKLTGQSCRIDIFREALKEFVPGKSIEFKQQTKEKQSIMELKLTCVRGAIQYVNARKMGFTDVVLTYRMPAIPYSISGYTHENKEVMLIYSLDRKQTYGHLSRNSGIRQLELFLKDGNGNLKYRYIYDNKPEDYVETTYEKIQDKYMAYKECIRQDDTDDIVESEVKFFIFAAKDQWGFFLVPVTRKNSILYMGREAFYAFENDCWEMDFFDGMK